MVNFALPFVALAMAASVAATPAPAETPATLLSVESSGTFFSFENWVEDIIANPDDAMSIDEAMEAAHAADVVGSAGGLEKRKVSCDPTLLWERAKGRDAVACVNQLVRKGNQGKVCGLAAKLSSKVICRIGTAEVFLSKSWNPKRLAVNCNNIARTMGKIFDLCWRSDDTISGSEAAIGANKMQVNIMKVDK